jgi:hypothetical protein
MDGADPQTRTSFPALPHWLRAHPYTILAVLFFVAMGVSFYTRHTSEWDDVFVRAAARMWDGENMYVPTDGYVYPPFMAWLAIPFAFLPHGVERLLFYAVNVLCVVLLCRWAWMLAGGKRLHDPATPRSEHVIFALGLACAFRYVVDGLAHQQVDVIIGCLVLGGCAALFRSRPWLAATSLGLAAAMKCTPLLWCPYLLWRRHWLPAAWLAVVAVGVNFLPNLVSQAPSGRPWAAEWLAAIAPFDNAASKPGMWYSDVVYNQSLSGLWNRFCETRWVWTETGFEVGASDAPWSATGLRMVVYGSEAMLGLAALMVIGWLPRRMSLDQAEGRSSAQTLEFSIMLSLMLLFSPMSSKPHFCILLLPAFCVARQALAGSRVCAVLLTVAILTGGSSVRGLWGDAISTLGLWWGSITWSTLCLFAGCWLLARRASEGKAGNSLPPVPALACASGSEYRRAG